MGKKHTGTAGPLGLFAFGITTTLVMLRGLYPGVVRPGFTVPVGYLAPLQYVFGGIVQIIAGVIEIYREDVYHGTVFACYGCFWVAVANGCGSVVFFCGWGLLTWGFWIISLRKNICSVILFTTLVVAFFLIAAGEGLNPTSEDILHAGQWAGFVTGCIALYAGFATLIHIDYKILLPAMAPMPAWFPLCCVYRPPAGRPKVRSIWGLRFTPSERAYYAGSPTGSLVGSPPVTPTTPAVAAPAVAPAVASAV